MTVDVVLNVGHTAVTNFYGVTLEDLVQHVFLWKFFIYNAGQKSWNTKQVLPSPYFQC